MSHSDTQLGLFLIELGFFSLFLIPTIIATLKGAPWVPTPMSRVKKILELAKIKPGETIYDLGCGDGRFVHIAAKTYKANAIGFELSPLVYLLAKIKQLFLRSPGKVFFKDFRKVNLKNADVIVCYLLPKTLRVFQKKFDRELKNGTRVLSYAFRIGDWQPVMRLEPDRKKNLSPVWVYVVGKQSNKSDDKS